MDPDDAMAALGTRYSAPILAAADEPTSVAELSEELGVPIATCYRRVEELTEAGLLEAEDRAVSDERRRTTVYRRTVDAVRVQFTGTDHVVETERRTTVRNTLDDVWRSLSEADTDTRGR